MPPVFIPGGTYSNGGASIFSGSTNVKFNGGTVVHHNGIPGSGTQIITSSDDPNNFVIFGDGVQVSTGADELSQFFAQFSGAASNGASQEPRSSSHIFQQRTPSSGPVPPAPYHGMNQGQSAPPTGHPSPTVYSNRTQSHALSSATATATATPRAPPSNLGTTAPPGDQQVETLARARGYTSGRRTPRNSNDQLRSSLRNER